MDRRERLRAILNEAMELPPERWPALIEERCGDDAELRDEALRHLSEAGELDSFLKQSARRDGRTLDLDRTLSVILPPTEALPLGSTIATPGAAPGAAPAAARRDDSRPTYELLEVLGQGGFGIVFRANQLTPVRRPVAIKYLRPERASAAQDIRFEAERQALASLSHPGIAKLLDAGTTPDGRQYFSMEYVEGIPLDRFCDRRRSGIRERLDLLVQACDAIQHAHFRGIIHRDLKPGNILAFEQDGVPVVRVIDLGLALATEEPLTAGSRLLREGPGTGTPTYMSPEQWQRDPSEIDTRSDVYSLGVVLYELLTGSLPVPLDEGVSLAEFGVRLTKGVPPAPSERFRSLPDEERREIAAARGLDPRGLARRLDPDLDAIAGRALEKDPRDRYSSPEALAADIRRHFAHEPVTAHPSTFRYRASKFLRRNRLPVAAAGAILLTASAGLAASALFRSMAQWERTLGQDLDAVFGAPARLVQLWPLGEEVILPLEALRARLVAIGERSEEYRQWLRGMAGESASGSDEERRSAKYRAGMVQTLLLSIDAFGTDDGRERYTDLREMAEAPGRGLLAEIDWRLGHARTLDERTRSGPEARAAWEGAAREIAASSRYAGMPPLPPQLGLLPLGTDPGSGLAEFWHVLSGTRPERDAEGRIRMRPEHGIVLVLVPGGTYAFGCEKPLAIEVSDLEGEVVVTVVVAGTAAESAGIAPEDRVLAANGAPIATAGDFTDLQRSLLEGGEVELSIRAAASGEAVSHRLRAAPPGPGRIVELGARPAEGPTQTVALDPYFISKFEVTQAQWARWTGRNPSARAAGSHFQSREYTADQPVESIPWAEAERVCEEMGLGIPTEAQWEAACRAGTRTPWHSGEVAHDIAGYANVSDRQVELAKISGWAFEEWLDDGFPLAAPVGTYAPNGFGLHDAMGNVWEWCAETGRSYGEAGQPLRPGDGARPPVPDAPSRIIRGGGYSNTADFARSARRWRYSAGGNDDVGVRPVRPLDPDPLRD